MEGRCDGIQVGTFVWWNPLYLQSGQVGHTGTFRSTPGTTSRLSSCCWATTPLLGKCGQELPVPETSPPGSAPSTLILVHGTSLEVSRRAKDAVQRLPTRLPPILRFWERRRRISTCDSAEADAFPATRLHGQELIVFTETCFHSARFRRRGRGNRTSSRA